MIGDNWKNDITPALDAGMKAIFVKTGKYRSGDEHKIRRHKHLFYTVANVKAAMALLI